MRDVVRYLHPDRIAKRTTKISKEPKGSKAWLACYPRAWTYVVDHLNAEQRTEAEDMLEEWNSVGLPDEQKLAYAYTHFLSVS